MLCIYKYAGRDGLKFTVLSERLDNSVLIQINTSHLYLPHITLNYTFGKTKFGSFAFLKTAYLESFKKWVRSFTLFESVWCESFFVLRQYKIVRS